MAGRHWSAGRHFDNAALYLAVRIQISARRPAPGLFFNFGQIKSVYFA